MQEQLAGRPVKDQALTRQALEAQAALLPYALATFAICLPIFVWGGSLAPNSVWMSISFALFAAAWGIFYAAVSWIKAPASQGRIEVRSRLQVACGLVWSLAVAEIAFFADHAGPLRETLLLMSVAAAILVVFFAAPWLPSLLIVGPAAAAAPVLLLSLNPETADLGRICLGAVALSLALALIFNRVLRRQFEMAADREALIADRAGAVDEARRLAQSKSDLVATLSHEIRNGLTGVTQLLAAAAERGHRSGPTREQVADALRAANELINVLNTTLDSETAVAGELMVSKTALDLPGQVRSLAATQRGIASAKGLELQVFIDPELETQGGAALGDAGRVRDILANLLSNALKYTVRGRVEARLALLGRDRMVVEIVDTGPGLDARELAQAFEPFHRVERTSAGTSGAGLGLSLSRELAQLMGGSLTASGAVGVGCCFRLELPFDPLAVAPAGAEPGDAEVPQPSERDTLRVLFAEDDALAAAMLRATLEQLGHQVVQTTTGRRAIDLARICDLDLIMIDGDMPGMDGPETIAEIRRIDGPAARAPIVAVIEGDADQAQACRDAGADAILRKPVSAVALSRAVADALAVKPATPNLRLVS
ncbi:MAG: hybrid sensor histidine kinase/response regulator [Alphaproteobacteria bacterium PA2]|nr:MAG: hybrid sensor histidine kinase/response regulator [Alphaproteobacteria bacterium PA2]